MLTRWFLPVKVFIHPLLTREGNLILWVHKPSKSIAYKSVVFPRSALCIYGVKPINLPHTVPTNISQDKDFAKINIAALLADSSSIITKRMSLFLMELTARSDMIGNPFDTLVTRAAYLATRRSICERNV